MPFRAVGNILVSVNPYKPVPLYGPDSYAMYRKDVSDEATAAAAADSALGEVSQGEESVGNRRDSVTMREVSAAPPHLFELAESAYTELVQTQRDQARHLQRTGVRIGEHKGVEVELGLSPP